MSDGHPKVRAHLRAKLEERLARLTQMLSGGAPDCLIAAELVLLGSIGPQLDPEGTMHHAATQHEIAARRAAGVCVIPRCERHADPDGDSDEMCSGHARMMDDEIREAVSVGIDPAPNES